ncbi:hypothetical protein ACG83_14475 [Frankia sp. R43]|uniref:hypothetical protein n=1 Tax=Frankia sp. R43 TaxID=269536 RepID=UPI0006CA3138|nr:hypothetical protein [Frankia sp. R43]KPM55164.1 hypothetical protein ACG83_14475 [Frankia sp. R43]
MATAPSGDVPSAGRRFSFLARHSVFGVLLLVGVALRLAAAVGYQPAFEFNGDSYAYIRLSALSEPDQMRPAGYPAFLRLLSETGADLWVVPTVQHVLAIAVATALYALLVHRRVAAPIAALAAAPLLLDAYQIVIEHFVMAETLFAVALVAAMVALMWSRRPSVWALALAGLLLGASGLVRTIGVAIGLLAFGYVVLRRLGWLRISVFGVFLAAPLIAYASWFNSAHGKIGLTGGDAAWLYGRVAPIADCDQLDLKPEQLSLCSPHPVGERPDPSYYVWDRNSPANNLDVSADERDELLRDFAWQVITRQPADYLRAVGTDLGHFFKPGRPVGPQDWPDATWRFPTSDEPRYLHNSEPLLGLQGDDHPTRTITEPWAGLLRSYQTRGFTPGPALAVIAGLGLLACLAALPRIVPAGLRGGDGRTRWHELTAERRRIGVDCLFLVCAGAAVTVVPAATVCFDYRYMLPLLFLLPPAAALATRQGHLLVVAWRERRDAAETSWRFASGTGDADAHRPFELLEPVSATRPLPPVVDVDLPTLPGEVVGGGGTPGGHAGDRPRDSTDARSTDASSAGAGTNTGRSATTGSGGSGSGGSGSEPTDGAPRPSAGGAPLPKRPPGATFETRERRRRPPVSLGPDARMPTPGTLPAASSGPTASTGTGAGRTTPGGRTGSPAVTGGEGQENRPSRGNPSEAQEADWDPPTMPPGRTGSGEPTTG